MDTNREIKISFAFSRRAALLALAVLFLAWHPAFLGSETLNLTTYYPAPYGGYVSILTTGQTLLARDGINGVGGTGVGMGLGTGANSTPQYKADVGGNLLVRGLDNAPYSGVDPLTRGSTLIYNTGGEGATMRMIGANGTRLYLENQNGTFRLINSGWTAELMTVDQGGNMMVAGQLTVPKGDVWVNNGTLRGLCREVGYGIGGNVFCSGNERIVTWYGNSGSICGMLFYGGAIENPGAWSPYTCTGQDRTGVMLCCRIQ